VGRRHLIIATAVALALSTACTSGGTDEGTQDVLGAKAMEEPAPALAGDSVDGRPLALSDLRGNVVVVNFWATWCRPCREEMPALQRVAASEPDVVVLEVDLMESGDKARSFLDSLGLDKLQPVLDTDGATTRRFGVLTLPSTFFVDKGGVIRHLEFTQMTEDRIRSGIAKAR
jgi:thiol-disulfide isomerase/thioredoxin